MLRDSPGRMPLRRLVGSGLSSRFLLVAVAGSGALVGRASSPPVAPRAISSWSQRRMRALMSVKLSELGRAMDDRFCRASRARLALLQQNRTHEMKVIGWREGPLCGTGCRNRMLFL